MGIYGLNLPPAILKKVYYDNAARLLKMPALQIEAQKHEQQRSIDFDAHLDLSMNAMEWNRDIRLPLVEIRRRELGMTDLPDRTRGVVSLPEMRRGRIGLCVATQIARYSARFSSLPGWRSPEQAWAQTQGQLAWYRAMEECGRNRQPPNLAGGGGARDAVEERTPEAPRNCRSATCSVLKAPIRS